MEKMITAGGVQWRIFLQTGSREQPHASASHDSSSVNRPEQQGQPIRCFDEERYTQELKRVKNRSKGDFVVDRRLKRETISGEIALFPHPLFGIGHLSPLETVC
jgi:hypothetical protein